MLDESVEIIDHFNESKESTSEDEDDEDYKSDCDEEDVSESEEVLQAKGSGKLIFSCEAETFRPKFCN